MYQEERPLITYQGFEIVLPMNMTEPRPYLWVVGNHKHKVDVSMSLSGCLLRVDNYLDNLKKKTEDLKEEVIKLKEKQISIKKTLEKQVDYAPLIQELKEKLDKIDKEMKEDE